MSASINVTQAATARPDLAWGIDVKAKCQHCGREIVGTLKQLDGLHRVQLVDWWHADTGQNSCTAASMR